MKLGIDFTRDSASWAWMARGPNQGGKGGGQAGGKDGTGADKDKGGGQRDGGTRDSVGTGNGAHAPQGNQAGKDSKGNDKSKQGGPKGGNTSGTSANGGTEHYVDAIDDPAMKSWNRKKEDEANVGESWTDGPLGLLNELGWAAAGMFGVDEQAPDTFSESAIEDSESGMPDPNKPTESAHVHLDPVQALANFAGLATGLPVGTAYGIGKWGLKQAGVNIPDIDLGPQGFGGLGTASGTGGTNTGGGTGAKDSGGLTGNALGDKGGGKDNGLLAGQTQISQQQNPVTAPMTTNSPSNGIPGVQAPNKSKFPTPTQKFQGASYWAGDWVYDPASQQVQWKQASNGLMP